MDVITLILAAVAAVAAVAALVVALVKRPVSRRELDEREERILSAAADKKAVLDEMARSEERICRHSAEVSRTNTNAMVETQKMISEMSSRNFAELRAAVETKLTAIQTDNAKKLEEMRVTVDEKLSSTLNTRLGESFKQVSERLEAVYKGLGEMQSLAGGVGDLKRMLSNVKSRGTWGEIQLGVLLEQILSPQQYRHNVKPVPGSGEIVEYAVVLPGREEDGRELLLPIDSKFPIENYARLAAAAETADAAAVDAAARELVVQIRQEARKISEKYVAPPYTTDFAIMFLPTEGLYAEVLRTPGLCEELQNKNRILVAGPTTLAALLNSLQMGFTTLAIQKRSSEVWSLLGAFKTQFQKFSDVLAKARDKIDDAAKVIDTATDRTRIIGKKLQKVEEIEGAAADELIGLLPDGEDET